MSGTLPTIVLIHGACHTPANYQTFVDSLKATGFSSERAEAGKRILMVMHSYGGMVGRDALTDELFRSTRASTGRSGGVIHLLYLSAYILQPGTTVIDIAKASGFFPFWPQFVSNIDNGSCFPIDPTAMFLGDAKFSDVEAALPHLVRSPLSAFIALSEGECWKTLPVTYVRTSNNGSVPPRYQEIMIERAEEEGVVILKMDYNTCYNSRENNSL
ncbi:hypothetical protein K458DRAFT_441054 [Lentithecium fluviatile CBS 122367]|uniref:AB hydrolase-1 domain-containing protein n=1 Tax=Lentithecium fluviatile CBS 122367 TaxID=1168545 RepID=A0A6G1J9K5_9PLEO|nr:hypothetical protein K458DRAFT_441054 [Lentithecium fluviatile CBS 122367]